MFAALIRSCSILSLVHASFVLTQSVKSHFRPEAEDETHFVPHTQRQDSAPSFPNQTSDVPFSVLQKETDWRRKKYKSAVEHSAATPTEDVDEQSYKKGDEKRVKRRGGGVSFFGRRERCTTVSKEFLLPRGARCPADCPFGQRYPSDPCSKVCVKGRTCEEIHPLRPFGDPTTMMCSPTCGSDPSDLISGCVKCKSKGVCAECARLMIGGFMLSEDGKSCLKLTAQLWPTVYAIVFISAMLLALYICYLSMLPVSNKEGNHAAWLHRVRCRSNPHDRVATQRRDERPEEWPVFPFTNVHEADVSGVGVVLYFDWLLFMFLIAVAIFGCTYGAYQMSDIANTGSHLTRQGCDRWNQQDYLTDFQDNKAIRHQHHVEEMEKYLEFEYLLFFVIASAHICFMVGAWLFSYRQKRTAKTWNKSRKTMQWYAVEMTNIPEDVDVDEFKTFLKNEKKVDIVDISPCFDFLDIRHEVDEGMDAWFDSIDKFFEHGPEAETRLEDPFYSGSSESDSWDDPFVRWVMRFTPSGASLETEHTQSIRYNHMNEVLRVKLKYITCSGSIIVVCRTIKERQRVLAMDFVFKDNEICVKAVRTEPQDMLWENYSRRSKRRDQFLGVLLLLFTIGTWGCLYLPYAMDYLQTMRIPGKRPGFYEDLLLGMLISLGNAIVSQVIEFIIPWLRALTLNMRDYWVLVIGFTCIFMNTMFDLFLVLQMAKGIELDDALEGLHTGYERVLAGEMFVLIVPGYLFLPYIVAPIFERFLPHKLAQLIVRSRRNFATRQAERAIEAPHFDICWRYADFINHLTVCILMLSFVSPNGWKVFAVMICSYALIYVLDYYFLLRYSNWRDYSSDKLSDVFSVMLVLPLSALFGVVLWWAFQIFRYPFYLAIILLGGNFALYLSVLLYIHRREHREWKPPVDMEQTYEDTVKHLKNSEGIYYDYFNTNPVFCLRYRLLDELQGDKMHGNVVPFHAGKIYLQQHAEPFPRWRGHKIKKQEP